MLGFTFSSAPTIQAQLDYLMRKANRRFFLLLHYKRAGIGTERLRDIYCAMTRSILEYSSNVYHSQINVGQSNELEGIQKQSLKVIYGFDLNYEELLEKSGLPMLKERRAKAFERFAFKTAKNEKYSHWFPLKDNIRQTRSTAVYKEEKAVGNRLFNSPIFAMRRILNNSSSNYSDQVDLTGIFNVP